MIIMFLVFNTIIFLCTSLGILMFNNNLKKHNRSIDIYLDPKAYKPESEVKLISLLLDKYNSYKDKETVDLESLIMGCFYNNKIGTFKVSGIETLANKGKYLLWISIIAMVSFETMTVGLGRSKIHSVGIIVSAALGIILALLELYSDIKMEKQQLFLRIKNYLNNEYPQFKTNQKEKEKVSFLLTKIEQLETKIKQYEETKSQQRQEEQIKEEKLPIQEELQEADIAQILKCFDIFT
ncbi:MAG TPA: hypothetical protein GX707_18520 [Epulopiscium sp.]|nr:hypothetical protein [Candidatus Epulonipiscium sp.]